MSAPDTNLERQKKRHRAPLVGIWASLALVAVLFIGWLLFYAVSPDSEETGGPLMQGGQALPENNGQTAPSN